MPFRAIIHSMILQTAGALTLSALLMFLPAGTFAWPQGWLFLALFFGLSQAMGLWLLDNADLEELSAVCAELGRWEFLCVITPLRIGRGTASPVNPLAIF